MDSALRPRDIQARIRAGASPHEVAEAAGVPLERIDAFAAPVIAEREYIAGLARTHPVRRRGETTSHRTLRNAVTDALAGRGVDAEDARWDAWKLEDRRWQIAVTYDDGDVERRGLFVFDALGRFSVSANDEGRALIGDSESDQLALVHAALGEPEEDASDDEIDDSNAVDEGDEQDAEAQDDTATADLESDADDSDDTDDAYADGDLAEVDGVYDLVTPPSDMDVLYDMLASFDEDSVKIYAGLVHPKESAAESAVLVVLDDQAEPERDVPEQESTKPAEPDAPPVPEPAGEVPALDEPEQLSLIDDVDEPIRPPKPRARKRRAAVPSWDEIMFGSPNAPKGDS